MRPDTQPTREPAPEAPERPCPFCGEALVLKDDPHGYWYAHDKEPGPCLISTVQLLDADDVEKWNSRAYAPD